MQLAGDGADQLSSRISTFIWMSSSAGENLNSPGSISVASCRGRGRFSSFLRGQNAHRCEHGGMGAGRRISCARGACRNDGGIIAARARRGRATKCPPHMVLVTSVEPCVRGEVSEEDVNRSVKRDRDASPATIVIAALLAAIAGFGTVYLIFAPSDNGGRELF